MRTTKESWKAFKDPMKQEIANAKDTIKYAIPDAIGDFKDEMEAEKREKARQEYLKNKSMLSGDKSIADYEREKAEASEISNAASNRYNQLLKKYISSGTKEQKGYAKSLRWYSKRYWYYLLTFVVAVIDAIAITNTESGTTFLIGVLIIAFMIAYAIYQNKLSKKAVEFFSIYDKALIEAKDIDERAFEKSLSTSKVYDAAKNVEKYEKEHK